MDKINDLLMTLTNDSGFYENFTTVLRAAYENKYEFNEDDSNICSNFRASMLNEVERYGERFTTVQGNNELMYKLISHYSEEVFNVYISPDNVKGYIDSGYNNVYGKPQAPKPAVKPYSERQAAAGLKVGDKVRVMRSAKRDESGWNNSWVSEMDFTIGTGQVIRSIGYGGVTFEECSAEFPYFVLEKVTDSDDETPLQKARLTADMVFTGKHPYCEGNYYIIKQLDDRGDDCPSVVKINGLSKQDAITNHSLDDVFHIRNLRPTGHTVDTWPKWADNDDSTLPDYKANYNACKEIKLNKQEIKTMMNPKDVIETKVFVLGGQDASQMSDDDLFRAVHTVEKEITKLSEVHNKPKKLDAKIKEMSSQLETLIKYIDTRD